MSKSNKVRYKSRGNQFPAITMTGKAHLRNSDVEQDGVYEKGDVQVYLSTDSLPYNIHAGDFEAIGYEGYLKANVFDGKGWKPLSLEEFFPGREHYFGKRERPIDTYHLCLPVFENMKGVVIVRTYREHYRVSAPGDKLEE
jgi:hypothetical protein